MFEVQLTNRPKVVKSMCQETF